MTANERFQYWLGYEKLDGDIRAELLSIKDDEKEIYERFYGELEFGTAGLRGVLGAGSARMNIYTVNVATQGLAAFLNASCEKPSCAIAYDSRNFSAEFARSAACVLAANGVQVHLYPELMPTPSLSFAVRHLHCDAGIVITASHNPAKYNGYKVYGPDGCQLTVESSAKVSDYIAKTDIFKDVKTVDYDAAIADGSIKLIGQDVVDAYIAAVKACSLSDDPAANAALKVVYTPLNGAGNKCVRRILKEIGVTDITVVPEQEQPDGNFPTCPFPNPEIKEALHLGLELSKKVGPDLLLATDPDSDRVGIAVRQDGQYQLLTGNEVGVLLLDYICKRKLEQGTMPERPVAVKSIVTSKMADRVAEHYGVEMRNVLTGFKFIGEQIYLLEQEGHPERYLLGFEESYGYLSGSYVRDKDAVDGSMLICEMAAYYKKQGRTLVDVLNSLYEQYGYYKNMVFDFAFEGADGMANMTKLMDSIRQNPPKALIGKDIVRTVDYKTGTGEEAGKPFTVNLPSSNVLEYGLSDGSSFIIRPSGTEPKIKIYLSAKGATREESELITARMKEEITVLIKG